MDLKIIILFGLIVFITHFLEGITGFGCTVLAMPFCLLLVELNVTKPVLVILAFLMALYIVIIAFKDIIWTEYLKIISFVLLGLPIGIYIYTILPKAILIKILATFMIIVAIRGLLVSFKLLKQNIILKNISNRTKTIKSYSLNGVLFLAGIIHGAFGTGGPLTVIYATKALPNKNNFRATLCLLWLSLNLILISQSFYANQITPQVITLIGWSIPFLIIGAILGNIAHHKIKDVLFTKVVYCVLLFSGIFMMI